MPCLPVMKQSIKTAESAVFVNNVENLPVMKTAVFKQSINCFKHQAVFKQSIKQSSSTKIAVVLEDGAYYQHLKNNGLVNEVKAKIREKMTKLKERIYVATDYSEVGGRIEAQGIRTRKERMQALKGKTWHIVARSIKVEVGVAREVRISFKCVEIAAARAVCRIVQESWSWLKCAEWNEGNDSLAEWNEGLPPVNLP